MAIKPKAIDDLDLFEAYTGKSVDDYEVEEIEVIIDKAHSEYTDLLKITDSDELSINVYQGLSNLVFSFVLNDTQIPYTIKPVLDLMFGSSNEVEEIEPNVFIVDGVKFKSLDELKDWITNNTPFTNVDTVETVEPTPSSTPYTSSSTINVNGVDVTLHELSEDEFQRRRWEHFANRFDDSHRVLVTVRGERFNTKVSLKMVHMFGSFDEGNWDIFNTAGNRTIQTLMDEKREANDPSPVTYIVGIKNDVPQEKVDKFQKYVNKMKLTSKE